VLQFIRRAREFGFSINDIRTLLDLAEPGDASCAEVEKVALTHLESVRTKLADLLKLERMLSDTVSQCAASETLSCPVLDILTAPPGRIHPAGG
jgi:MerR family mercuric resistance operon transcriptional regulator